VTTNSDSLLDRLHVLFEHLAWADDQVIESLRAAPDLPDADAVRELLAHILGAEHVWLARINGKPAEVAVWPNLSLDQCADLARRNQAGYRWLLEQLRQGGAAESVRYTNSAGRELETRKDDILLHVALHGSYHRGQIAARLRTGGAEPSPTDYIAFVRGVPAATRR
jgi:uncharacterized damage-inducible protein DinB